jgi:hypothetical protein
MNETSSHWSADTKAQETAVDRAVRRATPVGHINSSVRQRINNYVNEQKENDMRKRSILLAIVAMGIMAAAPAWAQCGTAVSSGAHLQGAVTITQAADGDLTLKATEAGLGFGDVCWSATGNASAVYQCVTNSGSKPKAGNKITVTGGATAAGAFPTKNGKLTASLTLEAPAAPDSGPPTCGTGQTLVFVSITWTNVALHDDTNNIDLYP